GGHEEHEETAHQDDGDPEGAFAALRGRLCGGCLGHGHNPGMKVMRPVASTVRYAAPTAMRWPRWVAAGSVGLKPRSMAPSCRLSTSRCSLARLNRSRSRARTLEKFSSSWNCSR